MPQTTGKGRIATRSGRTAESTRRRRSVDDQQDELFLRYERHGDQASRERLAAHFSPMACTLARRYGKTSEPFEDLCQVAQLGLLKAIDRFDPTRGLPFAAFAVPTILGELRRYFRNSGWSVHVPRGDQERALALREATRELGNEQGRAPTVPELAQFMKLSTEEVVEAMQTLRAYSSLSLDVPHKSDSGEEDLTYAESIGAEDPRYEMVELAASLQVALDKLEQPSRELLQHRFLDELTQTQIAERMGISQMQVSRLLKRCLQELRELAREQAPGELLAA